MKVVEMGCDCKVNLYEMMLLSVSDWWDKADRIEGENAWTRIPHRTFTARNGDITQHSEQETGARCLSKGIHEHMIKLIFIWNENVKFPFSL